MATKKKYLPIYDMWVTVEESDVTPEQKECEGEGCNEQEQAPGVDDEETIEVTDAIQEQVNENGEILENNPDAVTEELAQEANNFFVMALGRLGYGTDELKQVYLGQESKNLPVENLRITQKAMREFLKKNKKACV